MHCHAVFLLELHRTGRRNSSFGDGYIILVRKPLGRQYLGDLDTELDGRIVLKCTLNKQNMKLRTALN
jgi:hypothetical protein